jgi:membrane protein
MTGHTQRLLSDVIGALVGAIRKFGNNRGWMMSSHLAMSMMLALFPFVLFIVALAATLSQDIDINNLIELVFGSWPDEIAAPITSQVRQVVNATDSRLLTVGGLLAIYFASNGVDAVRLAMTSAYNETDTRPFWRSRLLSLLFVVLGGAGVLVMATLGVAVPLFIRFFGQAVPIEWIDWLASDTVNTLIPLIVMALGVLACHVWLPGHQHSVRQVLPGVALTMGLWGIAGAGFSYYISSFASYSATYAGLAGVMAALIFLYLMSAILILGAEFNASLARRRNTN